MATKAETNGQEEEKIRISFTIDADTRRKIRIASATADLEVGEWAQEVLRQAAIRQVKEGRK